MSKPSFGEWMAEVNRAITQRVGLVADDLADYPYRLDYEADRAPSRVAEDAISWADDEMYDHDDNEY